MSDNFYPDVPTFDELLMLAQNTPAQLNELQQQLNLMCISKASHAQSAWKLQRLLTQIAGIKQKYKHPQLVCIHLQELWQQVLMDEDVVEGSIKECSVINFPKSAHLSTSSKINSK